jgi:Lar family restriction alleviation protein
MTEEEEKAEEISQAGRTADVEKELLPCPFCGGEARMSSPDCESGYTAYVYIYCSKCGSKGHEIKFHIYNNCGGIGSEWRRPYERKAIEAWNMRKPLARLEIVDLRG